MSVHVKKCHPGAFQSVWDGAKPFEWRKEDDCKYEVGDVILLHEWEPERRSRRDPPGWPIDWIEVGYTGRVIKVLVTYVLRGKFGVPDGFAVLGIRRCALDQPSLMQSGVG